jgi:hypothetical protein
VRSIATRLCESAVGLPRDGARRLPNAGDRRTRPMRSAAHPRHSLVAERPVARDSARLRSLDDLFRGMRCHPSLDRHLEHRRRRDATSRRSRYASLG